jgi:hypothetical protein
MSTSHTANLSEGSTPIEFKIQGQIVLILCGLIASGKVEGFLHIAAVHLARLVSDLTYYIVYVRRGSSALLSRVSQV